MPRTTSSRSTTTPVSTAQPPARLLQQPGPPGMTAPSDACMPNQGQTTLLARARHRLAEGRAGHLLLESQVHLRHGCGKPAFAGQWRNRCGADPQVGPFTRGRDLSRRRDRDRWRQRIGGHPLDQLGHRASTRPRAPSPGRSTRLTPMARSRPIYPGRTFSIAGSPADTPAAQLTPLTGHHHRPRDSPLPQPDLGALEQCEFRPLQTQHRRARLRLLGPPGCGLDPG